MQILALLEKTAGRTEARRLLGIVEEVITKLSDKSSDSYRLAESSYRYAQGEMAYSDCEREERKVRKAEGEKALDFYKKSLETREALLKDHTDTARTLNAIGNCYMQLKDIEQALEYYTRALDMRKRLTGSQEHLDMPVYINQIASTHELLGKKYKKQAEDSNLYHRKKLTEMYQQEFNQALTMYREALDLEKKLHISGYASTATFYRNMSNTYSYLEDYESSLMTAKKALFLRKKLLGIDADTIRSYYQVGLAYEKLDEIDKALKYFYKAYIMELALPAGERSAVKDRVIAKMESNLGSTEEAEVYDKRHKEALKKGSSYDEILVCILFKKRYLFIYSTLILMEIERLIQFE
jgi:tetratricopeptide (TPR) repeat protein